MVDWEANQTITTLESIATPIQKVQFPTVTVCPHEHSPPDNWSFLEKVLNSITQNDPDLRKDIMNQIMTSLLDVLEKKHKSNPENPIWMANQNVLYETRVLIELSKLLCQNKINYGDIRKAFIEGNYFNSVISSLLGGEAIDNSGWTFYFCEDECCKKKITLEFFRSIINAGFFMLSEGWDSNSEKLTLGSALANFANLTSGKLAFGNSGIFDLDSGLEYDKLKSCQSFSNMDKFLQDYFKDIGTALGFDGNNSYSLFDLPSMLTSSFNYKEFSTTIGQQQVECAKTPKHYIRTAFLPIIAATTILFLNL